MAAASSLPLRHALLALTFVVSSATAQELDSGRDPVWIAATFVAALNVNDMHTAHTWLAGDAPINLESYMAERVTYGGGGPPRPRPFWGSRDSKVRIKLVSELEHGTMYSEVTVDCSRLCRVVDIQESIYSGSDDD